MPVHFPLRLPRLRRRLTEWLVFGAGLVFSAAILGAMLLVERSSTLEGDADRMRGQAVVIDGALRRQLEGVRSALESARHALGVEQSCDRTCRLLLLQSLKRSMPGVRALMSINPDGRIALSDDDLGDRRLDDRDFLRESTRMCGAAALYLSGPFENTPGEFNLKVAMSRLTENGCGHGVISAILNPEYFDAVMRSALYAPDMHVSITDNAGRRLLYVPPDAVQMRRRGPDPLVAAHLASGDAVTVRRAHGTDGVERMVVQRSMALGGLRMDRSLVIGLGRDVHQVLHAWRRLALTCATAWLLFWLSCGSALVLAQRRRRALLRMERAAEAERLAAAERIELALNGASLGLWDWDLARRRVRVDARSCAMLGYTLEDQEGGIDWSALVHPDDRDAVAGAMARHLRGHAPSFEAEFRMRHRGGHWLWILSRGRIVARDAGGRALRMVGTRSDISARKQAEAEIAHLAYYDGLTNLPNRRLLTDRLRQALAKTERSGGHGAVLFVDLDNFKTLNDTLGHEMGDRLLERVACRLREVTRETDTVARLGGDEFVVLLEDLGPTRQQASSTAGTVARKVLDALSLPYRLDDHELRSSPSIGVAVFGDARQTMGDLLRQADMAMYEAKSAGRATYRFFDPDMQAAVDASTSLEADLRLAVARQEFTLFYQPVVDAEGRLTGVEALVRWHHPRDGLVPPSVFIPQAEKSGLIAAIGDWVLAAACAQLAAWDRAAQAAGVQPSLSMAINVSARQFHQDGFVERALATVARSGADPRRIKLELTESMLLRDADDTIARLALLRRHGIGFALDDFGTGYSSLNYLQRLPLDQLKIDQSFVRDMLHSEGAAGIVRAIVQLASSLRLQVVAEGVETEAQWLHLCTLGCGGFQGYLFDRPLPPAELARRYGLGKGAAAA